MGRDDDDERRKKKRKHERKRHRRDDDSSEEDRRRRKKKKHRKKRRESSASSSSSSDSDESSTKQVVNERLLQKLAARGETLEERQERRARKRAAHIQAKFGYTAEENPFHDANLHETFTWKKKDEKADSKKKPKADNSFAEIEKVRKRRKDRESHLEEMERIRAEEARMKELENYDDWARKEEEFHLQQQRQRSAIRLVEGREKPIDVLAKNLLLFGLSEEEKQNRASVNYKERFNALDALENLEGELDEPQNLLKQLKLEELKELLVDIDAFRALEREACAFMTDTVTDESNAVLKYWDALHLVAGDEIKMLQTGGEKGPHAKMAKDVQEIFTGQSAADLAKMQIEVRERLRRHAQSASSDDSFDRQYWLDVDQQLAVHLAKVELSELHSKMLVRQLDRLEKRKEELAKQPAQPDNKREQEGADAGRVKVPEDVDAGFGDLEEELGLTDEIDLDQKVQHAWQDKYRPRKPRYFNRVKTGYDWNAYNRSHFDKDSPPPRIVQGYQFSIFYPDLIDPTKTPQFFLEPADSDEFCIIRFHAGPPYEDVAFKIVNRQWNKSRRSGYKCTFERGVLSLYFNFETHWYRR